MDITGVRLVVNMTNILVADDDNNIRKLIRLHLTEEGYRVMEAEDGVKAVKLMQQNEVHLAIVDLMMPSIDGYQLCKQIRLDYDIPVIILTAKDGMTAKEKGFSAGTDDYVTKPFEPKELIFRIKALLRRFQVATEKVITFNQTVINKKSYEVTCSGHTLILPLKEFELLYQLASFPERTFTREDLIVKVWGSDFKGDDRTVDVHIKRLRERFRNRTDDFTIRTVRGLGYQLEVTHK